MSWGYWPAFFRGFLGGGGTMVEDVSIWEEIQGSGFHILFSNSSDRGMMMVNLPSVITSVINRFRMENGGANSAQEMQLL